MTLTTTASIPVEVHLGPEQWTGALRAETAAGLTAVPRELPPTWLSAGDDAVSLSVR